MFFVGLGAALTDFLFAGLPTWVGLTLVLYFKSGMGLPSALNLLLFFVSFALSFLLMFFFNLCFGFLGFVTKNGWGLSHTKWVLVNLLTGRMIPLSFFPAWAQVIFDYLPFKSMTYTTILIYLGKLSPQQALGTMGIQLAWTAVFAVLSVIIWRSSIRRLAIHGG
jgi:ABC-2 type transport system permease protein